MKVKHIFTDIDGTLVVYPENVEFSRSPMALLEDLVMEKHGIHRNEANRKIKSCGNTAIQCLSEFLEELEIPGESYFKSLCSALENNLQIPDDTVRFLEFLKVNNFEVYTATTNSPFVTWAKLAVAGLASVEGTTYFTGYFPGCSFKDPRGKNDPEYYDKILQAGCFAPEYSMMIGDIPEKDAIPALKAGMRYGVNIDRSQADPIIEKDGILRINSFDHLIPLLEK